MFLSGLRIKLHRPGPIKTLQGYHVIRWTSFRGEFLGVSDLEQNQLAKFTDLLKSSAVGFA